MRRGGTNLKFIGGGVYELKRNICFFRYLKYKIKEFLNVKE